MRFNSEDMGPQDQDLADRFYEVIRDLIDPNPIGMIHPPFSQGATHFLAHNVHPSEISAERINTWASLMNYYTMGWES